MTKAASKPSTRPAHEQGTEGLRGFAALLVLYTHLLSPAAIDPACNPWPGFMALEASQAAVLLFFILSGYVIGLTNTRPFSAGNWRDYLWRRVIRLVPIYWIAILFSELVRPTGSWGTVLANVLFLQNSVPYGDWLLPVIRGNSNLWTLNYEALYYLLFAVCWIRPSAWRIWAAGSLVAAITGWILPLNWAMLTTTYAMGWLFWLIGYGLSQLKSDHFQPLRPLPWISVLFFWITTWQEKPLWVLCNRLDLLPSDAQCWITYSYIDIIPASIVLLLAASGRRPRGTRLLCWLSAFIPLVYLAWVVFRGRMAWWPPSPLLVFCLLGCTCWRWRPDGAASWGRLAGIGSISYALYVLQRPVQWLVHDMAWLPAGNAGTLVLRLALVFALLFPAAWFAERKLQPWLRSRLNPRRRVAA